MAVGLRVMLYFKAGGRRAAAVHLYPGGKLLALADARLGPDDFFDPLVMLFEDRHDVGVVGPARLLRHLLHGFIQGQGFAVHMV